MVVFRIPLADSNIEKLKSRSKFFASKFHYKKKSSLKEYLEEINIKLTREEYLGIVFRSFVNTFLILLIVFASLLMVAGIPGFWVYALGLSGIFSISIAFSQLAYPKVFASKREKDIEKNLIFALEDILIQLNSGIPLFDILTNISMSDYGELSLEFRNAVKKIGAGEPEAEVLADISAKSHSVFLKRTLWQISNGLNAGSDMSMIIVENIRTLNEEQMIQIQNYGNKLNPLIMMYMLISVIVPALSVSFMTVVASMIGLEKNLTMGLFLGFFVFVVLFQIMFLGMIKSKRPSLL
ncbi:type II secretion system F family protein [Candidatus Pacearchaeota archaeon]|nr:type II secretion system F family protein [Candidatus Pacearchaeota archaeon]